jgi:hypothetical protein
MAVSIAKVNSDGMWLNFWEASSKHINRYGKFHFDVGDDLAKFGLRPYDLTKPCRRFSSFCCKTTTHRCHILEFSGESHRFRQSHARQTDKLSSTASSQPVD